MKLKQIIGITKILSDRKVPEDVEKFLNDKYYSKSKDKIIKFGEMDFFHFIRAGISDKKKQWELYHQVDDKLHKIQKIMEE